MYYLYVQQHGGHARLRRSVERLVPLVLSTFSRAFDCEIQALAHVLRQAEQFGSSLPGGRIDSISGDVYILVDQMPCISCIGAMAQFRALLPEVKLHCHFHRLRLQREVERERGLLKRRGMCHSVYQGGVTGEHGAGKLSFSQAISVLREMLRAVSTQEEETLLALLGAGEKPGYDSGIPMPLSVMLPSSGTFHELIRLALGERRVDEALGLLAYIRKKEIRVFARSLAELAMDPKVPPRLAVKLVHEMQASGLPASRSLLRFLLQRLAELELPKPKGRGAVSLVRQLCYLHHEDLDISSYFRLGFVVPDKAKKQQPTGGMLAQCIMVASPELWPRWGRALGIWAKRNNEDPSGPFRALLDVSGIRKTAEAAFCGDEHIRRHQQKVLQALSQTGLLERMITKRVLTEAEVFQVRQIQKEL